MATLYGVKALIGIFAVIFFLLVVFIIAFNVLLLLLPVIIVLGLLGYFFRKLHKVKKPKKEYIDVEFKEK